MTIALLAIWLSLSIWNLIVVISFCIILSVKPNHLNAHDGRSRKDNAIMIKGDARKQNMINESLAGRFNTIYFEK